MDKPETIEEGLEMNLIYKEPKVGMCILLNRHQPHVFLFECVLKGGGGS